MFFDMRRLVIFSVLIAAVATLPVAEPAPVGSEDLRRGDYSNGNADWRREKRGGGNGVWRRGGGTSDWRRGNSDVKREELDVRDNSA